MRLAERTIVLLGEAVEASPATSFLVALQPSQLLENEHQICVCELGPSMTIGPAFGRILESFVL